MKKIFFVVFALCCSHLVSAQDILVKKNGDLEKVKVQEVTPTQVKYKKISNLEGPTYTEDKANLISVQFENGEVEKFSVESLSNSNSSKSTTSNDGNYFDPISKKWRFGMNVMFGAVGKGDDNGTWSVGFFAQRNINKYLAINVFNFNFLGMFDIDPTEWGMFNFRVCGIKGYTPAYKKLRGYASLDLGYTHGFYRAYYYSGYHQMSKHTKYDTFGLDFSVGVQVSKYINLGYNLTYINEFKDDLIHSFRLSIEL